MPSVPLDRGQVEDTLLFGSIGGKRRGNAVLEFLPCSRADCFFGGSEKTRRGRQERNAETTLPNAAISEALPKTWRLPLKRVLRDAGRV